MRTRFLATDYFSAASPVETLGGDLLLLSLPAPHLSSASPDRNRGGDIPGLHPDVPVSKEIDRIPSDGALSEFLHAVVPRFQRASPDAGLPEPSDLSYGGELEPEKSGSRGIDIEASEILARLLHDEWEAEKNSVSRSNSSLTGTMEESKLHKGFHFELVELDFPLKESVNSTETGPCFEVPDIEIPTDVIQIEVDVTVSYLYGIVKSIYFMEDIPTLCIVDQDCISVNDDCYSPDGISYHNMKLPHFEVNEIAFELESSFPVKDAFEFLLPNIESWHGVEDEELVINAKEILGSCVTDFLKPFSGYSPSEHCLVHKQEPLKSILDTEFIYLNDEMILEKNSAMFPIMSDGDCSHLPCSVSYDEVEVLDLSSQAYQLFGNPQIAEEQDMSGHMLKEDMGHTGSFYESVLSSELVLADATFKSLPAPILSDDRAIKPLSLIIQDILNSLEPHPLSTSDGIYLDWHPLMEGPCNREICSAYMNMMEEVSSSNATYELQTTSEEVVAVNFDFIDDPSEKLNMLECKEVPTELQSAVFHTSEPSANPAIKQMFKDDTEGNKYDKRMSDMNHEKVSVLFEAMSQSNDLNFFLDVRRGIAKRSCEGTTMKKAGGEAVPIICLEETSEPVALPKESFEQWDIVIHQFRLSDDILSLISDMHKTYVEILENCTELRRNISFQVANDFESLNISRQKLLELITERIAGLFNSKDETLIAYIMLYTVKRLAYFLCFFGVHTAYLYISNLTRSIGNLTQIFRSLESLIEDAYRSVEKQLIESHPSLFLVEEILMSTTAQNGNKILIVAERPFWLPLNFKLTSLRIKFHELEPVYQPGSQLDNMDNSELTNSVLEALLHSDCLLISHQHIPAAFPFNKFGIILEYGGPYASSKISSISPNLHRLPRVHLLKIDMENHNQAKALCEGCEMSQHPKYEKEVIPPYKPGVQGSLSKHHLVALLEFVPIGEKNSHISFGSANILDASHYSDSAMSTCDSVKHKNSGALFIPAVVVIVNTQSFEKKMLVSRRSSYQKILALEKGGAQMVEREINLPLDLIFSAAVCLVWYEAGSIGDSKASAASAVETSCITMFIEKIATNILMSLSFSFSGCIMIFEGESNFLAAIMEYSDALYAAAASLDMNLQLFCSYMAESTDEIILSCIKNANRFNRGLFPAMPESETLGESFLTRFPCINPLSAHAILSSGGTLVEFLEWSHELRIQAIGKYHIPYESVSLFSMLCRYGELGESKSVMTECSSIDSDSNSEKVQSQRKRQKFVDTRIDGSLYVQPLDQLNDGITDHLQAPQPCRSRFLDVQGIDRKTESHKHYMNDKILGMKWRFNTSVINNLDQDVINGCEYFKKDFSKDFNEDTIDCKSTFLNKKFPPIPGDINFLRKPESSSRPAIRSLPTRRLASGSTGQRTFPTSAEINSDIDDWTSQEIQNQNIKEKFCGWLSLRSDSDTLPVKYQENLQENLRQESKLNVHGSSIQGKVSLQSSRPQQCPYWTIDFLNRVKEKRRMNQQTVPCSTCLSCPGSSMSKEKYSKNRSPSIIESYRFREGNQMKKTVRQRWSKGVKVQQNSGSEKRKESSFISPTWTPIDKRARQNLSFARNGNEKQCKLIWRSGHSPRIGCNLRKRFRDEG